MENIQKVLVLAPHTDDGEIGCGGTIAGFIRKKKEVYYAAFSIAEDSIPEGLPKDILATEVTKATNELGIKKEKLLIYKYRVRRFARSRQEILENLVALNREIHPDLVLMPSIHDLHQDHFTIANEGLRAFKKTSILSYEIPWNNLNFSTQCYVTLTEDDLQRKIDALNCYESQKFRSYFSEAFIRSLAVTRGTQIGDKYAEVFEVVRWKL